MEDETPFEAESKSTGVLNSPELLNYIFSFVNTPTLIIASKVCPHWSRVAVLNLKRRFGISQVSGHTRLSLYMKMWEPATRTPSETQVLLPFDCSAVEVGSNKNKGLKEKLHRPFILLTLLRLDWKSAIQVLLLNCGTMSIKAWNKFGVHLLAEFPSLLELELEHFTDSSPLDVWHDFEEYNAEMEDCPVEKLVFKYQLVTYNTVGNSLKAETCMLDLTFLNRLDKLKKLDVQFTVYKDQEPYGEFCELSCQFDGETGKQRAQVSSPVYHRDIYDEEQDQFDLIITALEAFR